jgi:hypothetical protein
VILITTLPRGEPAGASHLIALDRETLQLLEVREFPAKEYLEDAAVRAPGRIRHARGIAIKDGKLYVALFNIVREYEIVDLRRLELLPGRYFTSPLACDLHGICVRGDTLAAASTGTDSLICWDLRSEEAVVTPIGDVVSADVRFPERLALAAGKQDWREVLRVSRHVNGVSIRADGTPVVCSLTQVLEIPPEGPAAVHEKSGGRMHDGCLSPSGELLLTDAAGGLLIALDLDSRDCRCFTISDPADWFVRGIGVADGIAYVLGSEPMPSRQRDPHLDPAASVERGSSVMISTVDLATGYQMEEEVLRLSQLARGSVAYGLAIA